MGKKCAGLVEFSSGKAVDTSGQEEAAGSSKNCKSPSKKNLILKPTKTSFQPPSSPDLTSTGVKVKRKSAKTMVRYLLRRNRFRTVRSHQNSWKMPLTFPGPTPSRPMLSFCVT